MKSAWEAYLLAEAGGLRSAYLGALDDFLELWESSPPSVREITVFGATGGVGRFVVKHALDRGHEVRAYVRNPDKLQMQHERLTR